MRTVIRMLMDTCTDFSGVVADVNGCRAAERRAIRIGALSTPGDGYRRALLVSGLVPAV